MEYFLGSVNLMFIIYAMAAVISFGVAALIKGIFACIKMKQTKVQVVKPSTEPVKHGQVGQGA